MVGVTSVDGTKHAEDLRLVDDLARPGLEPQSPAGQDDFVAVGVPRQDDIVVERAKDLNLSRDPSRAW